MNREKKDHQDGAKSKFCAKVATVDNYAGDEGLEAYPNDSDFGLVGW